MAVIWCGEGIVSKFRWTMAFQRLPIWRWLIFGFSSTSSSPLLWSSFTHTWRSCGMLTIWGHISQLIPKYYKYYQERRESKRKCSAFWEEQICGWQQQQQWLQWSGLINGHKYAVCSIRGYLNTFFNGIHCNKKQRLILPSLQRSAKGRQRKMMCCFLTAHLVMPILFVLFIICFFIAGILN